MGQHCLDSGPCRPWSRRHIFDLEGSAPFQSARSTALVSAKNYVVARLQLVCIIVARPIVFWALPLASAPPFSPKSSREFTSYTHICSRPPLPPPQAAVAPPTRAARSSRAAPATTSRGRKRPAAAAAASAGDSQVSEASSAVGGRGGAKKRRLPAWATASAGGSSRRGRDDDDVGGVVLSFVLLRRVGLSMCTALEALPCDAGVRASSPRNLMCTTVQGIIIF